jgi:hypothetical protein
MMLNLFGKIFGTEKAITSTIDTVTKGLDALVYTDQEKDEHKAKFFEKSSQVLIDWMEASQGHRLARRVIALSITFVWLFMFIVSSLLNVVSVWVADPARFQKSAEIIGGDADSMQGAVLLILSFYFAAPHIGEIIKPAIEKFSKGTK